MFLEVLLANWQKERVELELERWLHLKRMKVFSAGQRTALAQSRAEA